jgi:hypothetical protein
VVELELGVTGETGVDEPLECELMLELEDELEDHCTHPLS